MERSDPVTEGRHLPGAAAHAMITGAEARLPGAGNPAPTRGYMFTWSEMANGFFCPISPLSITPELLKLLL